MTREMRLRCLILDRYASLRQFAQSANIPYSTLLTVLSRGISGASFDLVMQICHHLSIDPREL